MPEPRDVSDPGDRPTIQADLDRVLMMAFRHAMDVSGFTPMAVMCAMATAFGAVYGQVAEHHQNQLCPCGWQPVSAQDIEMLQSAFEAAAKPALSDKLLTMQVLGRA